MSGYSFPSVVALCYWLLVGLYGAKVFAVISPISAVGSKFFHDNGQQYYVKGIAYQLTANDPLVDTEQCKLDAALMEELGANAIRVYHVDPNSDHDGCMEAFADAGVYVFVDLDTFTTEISEDNPHWNVTQFNGYKKVLDVFQGYENTAGVFVGNEVLTTSKGFGAAPYIKAAARDIKAYRESKGYRKIPVGYSAADIASLRPMLQNYMACSKNSSENLDFFSLNAYEWCGRSSFTLSGYSMLAVNATGYTIPIFFSETGCNTNPPRDFMDQTAILGPSMEDTWSGAVIYEWIQETNDYGLVSYGPYDPEASPTIAFVEDGYTRRGTPTPVYPDFDNLKSRWATLKPSGVALADYSAFATELTPPPCPAPTSDGWDLDAESPLPSLGQSLTMESTTTASSATETGTEPTERAGPVTGGASRISIMGPANVDGVSTLMMLLAGTVGVLCWWL
ncbi:hypothetical protein Egran_00622 [Elaphomyces granulatus]|uniref:1,3-beta-glucanosyltransferase n=1 Tax=Elaphomyces granulatus TaxID=519963 RepID=A0A232M5K1_9EURO|nr:hypothetical protein Egran_00622 [Elaphomyces granulatus]